MLMVLVMNRPFGHLTMQWNEMFACDWWCGRHSMVLLLCVLLPFWLQSAVNVCGLLHSILLLPPPLLLLLAVVLWHLLLLPSPPLSQPSLHLWLSAFEQHHFLCSLHHHLQTPIKCHYYCYCLFALTIMMTMMLPHLPPPCVVHQYHRYLVLFPIRLIHLLFHCYGYDLWN